MAISSMKRRKWIGRGSERKRKKQDDIDNQLNDKDQRAMKRANSLNRTECSEYSIIDDYKCKTVE